jgi:8-amino-7-oxononanoate synthase
MSALAPLLENALDAIRGRNEYRQMIAGAIAPHGRIERAGRSLLDFSSNDYLGLTRHPLLVERAADWAGRFGAGAGASRLVVGTTDLHLGLEARIAAFKGTEAALLFASGWQANAAVIPALLRAAPNAHLFTDRLVHASVHHGCAAAGVKQIRFRHNDLDHLDELLGERAADGNPAVIVTESLFSMEGDSPDVRRLADIADRHHAFLYLDEAHATGVLGPGGAGLSPLIPGSAGLVMGTFSKAMGSFGAYVAGSKLLCDYLVNACSGFIFTTALPPAVLGAIDAALDLVPTLDAERARLAQMAEDARTSLRAAGIDTGSSDSHIVPAIIGNAERTLALSRQLDEADIIAAAIRPPTVPPGSSRIRLALRCTHEREDLDRLLEALTSVRSVTLSPHP